MPGWVPGVGRGVGFSADGTTDFGRVSQVVLPGTPFPLSGPFVGTFISNMQTIANHTGIASGATVELVVACYTGPLGVGPAANTMFAQSTFLTVAAGGGSYTTG